MQDFNDRFKVSMNWMKSKTKLQNWLVRNANPYFQTKESFSWSETWQTHVGSLHGNDNIHRIGKAFNRQSVFVPCNKGGLVFERCFCAAM